MRQQAREPEAPRTMGQLREEGTSQLDLCTSSQASATTEDSKYEEAVETRTFKRHLQEDSTTERASTSAPSPKRRRTDGGNAFWNSNVSPSSDRSIANSTFSGPRRLTAMQRSFESHLNKPAASASLLHSKSDPSPMLQLSAGAPTSLSRTRGKSKESPSIRASEEARIQCRSTSIKPTGNAANAPKAKHGPHGISARLVEPFSDCDEASDSATEDERTPTRPQRENFAGFDGRNVRGLEMEDGDTQLTLSDAAFESQERDQQQEKDGGCRIFTKRRKSAYRAVQGRGGCEWDGLISSGGGHGTEALEL